MLKITGVWTLLLIAFIFELLAYTWCRVQCVQTGYRVSYEMDRYQNLMAHRNNLKIELARLKSPERIALIARTRLGLVTPALEQMVNMPDGAVIGHSSLVIR